MAIQRILRQQGLLHSRRHKYQKKQDLAAWKRTWALIQQISADTKDLQDIPHYWPQMKAHQLPAIQYTARELRSGLQFLAYASQRSAQASELFAQFIQRHLQSCGVRLREVTRQTDNGSEFIGQLQPDGSRAHFPLAVTDFGSQHERIPPAAHTYQSAVETVHRLIAGWRIPADGFCRHACATRGFSLAARGGRASGERDSALPVSWAKLNRLKADG
jgi:hypothetical protein